MAVRNTLVALVLSSLFGSTSRADPPEAAPGPPRETVVVVRAPVELGGRAGLLASALSGSGHPDVTTDLAIGFAAAFTARVTLGPWSLGGELGMSSRGAQLSQRDGDPARLRLYYVDLPLIAGFDAEVGLLGLPTRVEAGVSVSALAGRNDPPGSPTVAPRRIDAGALFGLGIGARLSGGGRLGCDLRYVHGVRDLDADANVKSRVFGVALSYVY